MVGPDDASITVSSDPLTEAADQKTSLDDEIKRGEHKQRVALRNLYALGAIMIAIGELFALNLFFALDAIGFVPGFCWPFHVSDDLFKSFTYSLSATAIAFGLVAITSLFPGENENWLVALSRSIFGPKAG
ncbi:MAG TPA: hypothetical protein VMA98_04570 [Candidatus Acidoferrales bacterium]|nr:hypothetical protein [Candidatus Acidoferrales bacterium]